MVFTFCSPYEPNVTLKGFFKLGEYEVGKRKALQIYAYDEELETYAPYAFVTVNLPNFPISSENCVWVDVNNAPWLERFLIDHGFGVPTGKFRTSGFVNYPEYFIYWGEIKKYRLDHYS